MATNSELSQTLWDKARAHLKNPRDPRLAQLALTYYEQALALAPNNLDLLLDFGDAYARLGQQQQALELCERALTMDPQSVKARWAQTLWQIPHHYTTAQDIETSRAAYTMQLAQFAAQLDLSSPKKISAAADGLSKRLPFYLAHQAQNDAALQRVYGEMLHRVFTARYPAFASPPPPAPRAAKEPLRVGIVADEFRNHSVWKVILKGWVTKLNHERFALYGYATNEHSDAETEIARTHCVKFTQGKFKIHEWAEKIRADELHVLIYSAIGMAKMPSLLAALHLAPVQCVATGHALTSGLPSMDYCLSGEGVETPRADAHYTEQLVRLPNLGIYYQENISEWSARDRASYGLREKAVVYFVPHSLWKLLPQYDFIYPEIARAVGDCQFVFMQNKQAASLTRQFEKRLAHAFQQAGLDARAHLVLQPRLKSADFQTLQQHADIYLDSLGYGGMTSALEALAFNLPIVTRRGDFYRNNFCAALCTQINVTETIADTAEEFVAHAIRLGKASVWRAQVREKIAAQKHLAYCDRAAIEGLENFLEHAAQVRAA